MLRGGCFCRAVRYEIDAEPVSQTACHCTICRHTSGAPFVAWFSVPASAFRFVTDEPASFRSSEQARRTFCASCGTSLTFQSTLLFAEIDVTTCSLDEPEQAPPKDHTFVRSKLSWVTAMDDLPAYPTSRADGP